MAAQRLELLAKVLQQYRRARLSYNFKTSSNVRSFGSAKLASYDSKIFKVSEEVEEAVSSGKPVVALETTIYTHGYPYPDNVALASHLESVVRLNGGIPATIGVLNGIARVGLSPEEIIQLASAAGKPETKKVSRRDLPYITGLGITSRKIHGGTTVSGTMILAKLAGIEVFGTGGLGGVHRGAQDTMDISADLTELGRTPVAVISSGCKSFLDIPRTLEYLETQGVAVSTFADGRQGKIDFPAFWTRESGLSSPSIVQDEKEAAVMIYARRLLKLESGLLFANPIPKEHSLPKFEIDGAIEQAVHEAAEKGHFGHANTPFILAKIKELTGGKSLPANRALIESNVARAARVAVELSKIGSSDNQKNYMPSSQPVRGEPLTAKGLSSVDVQSSISASNNERVDVLVAGSVALDFSCDYIPPDSFSNTSPELYTSNPAKITQSVGGVGHNVAAAAHLISDGTFIRLCSVVADDFAGGLILSSLKQRGFDTKGIMVLGSDSKTRTAQYVAINRATKDLEVGLADMGILDTPRGDFSSTWQPVLDVAQPKWVVVDGNWNDTTLRKWAITAKTRGAKVAFEPVSVAKARRLFPPVGLSSAVKSRLNVYPSHEIDLSSPNKYELASMHAAAHSHGYFGQINWWLDNDAFEMHSSGARTRLVALTNTKLVEQGVPQQAIHLLPYIPTIITKLGAEGVLVTMLLGANDRRLFTPANSPYILSRHIEEAPYIGGIYMRLFPAAEKVPSEDVVSVNGVGDTLLGSLIAGLAKGVELDERLIGVAQKAAVMTLKSKEAVSPRLTSLKFEISS